MPRLEATPTPAVLIWARNTSGLTLELAAKKAGIKPEQLLDWENGASRPSLPQLRKLASTYKRPLAVFYLPEAPKRFEVMHDYRVLDSEGENPQTPELAFEVRRAHDRREWALELVADLDVQPKSFASVISHKNDEEEAAMKLRGVLGVTFQMQTSWRTDYDAFREWRALVESAGVLTFQATEIALEEARGFSISQRPFPVVVVNIKDAPRGRIFTLLHELSHVMLNESGICDLHDSEIEAFCNRVASAALFPRAELLATDVVRKHPKNRNEWDDSELQTISRLFGGSREAALVRLMNLGLTSSSYYKKKRKQFHEEYAKIRAEKREGFAPPHVVAISSAGPTFTGLVIENLNRENITASDVSDLLQIRVKHLNDIVQDYGRMSA